MVTRSYIHKSDKNTGLQQNQTPDITTSILHSFVLNYKLSQIYICSQFLTYLPNLDSGILNTCLWFCFQVNLNTADPEI